MRLKWLWRLQPLRTTNNLVTSTNFRPKKIKAPFGQLNYAWLYLHNCSTENTVLTVGWACVRPWHNLSLTSKRISPTVLHRPTGRGQCTHLSLTSKRISPTVLHRPTDKGVCTHLSLTSKRISPTVLHRPTGRGVCTHLSLTSKRISPTVLHRPTDKGVCTHLTNV